ncbi:MAG TPA: ATP-binding protein [bacterium]|nr:ATP-binding protein [bacterium]
MPVKRKEESIWTVRFFIFYFLLISVTASAASAIYLLQESHQIAELKNEKKYHILLLTNTIHEKFSHLYNDVLFLSSKTRLEFENKGYNQSSIDELKAEYFHFAANKPEYDHVRFLDTTGMEIIRINRNDNENRPVFADKLQDKSNRLYFQTAIKMGRDELCLSKLDLNVENEKIEVPFKPVIRISRPVFVNGKVAGITVLNYKGEEIINIIRNYNKKDFGRYFLIKDDGSFALGPSEEYEWGSQIEERAENTVEKVCPEHTAELTEKEAGQFFSAGGLVTYRKIEGGLFYKLDKEYKVKRRESLTVISVLTAAETEFAWRKYFPFLLLLLIAIETVVVILWQQNKKKYIVISRKLHEKRTTLNMIADNIEDSIMLVEASGKVLYRSRSTDRMFSISGTGRILSIQDLMEKPGDFVSIMENGKANLRIAAMKTLSGKNFYAEISAIPDPDGNSGQYIMVIRDITRRMQLDQKILKLSNAVEQSGDIIFITDKSGTIEYINPAFVKVTEFTEEDAIGKNPRILKSGMMDNEYYKNLRAKLRTGEIIHMEVINRKKGGEVFYYDQTIAPVFNKDGRITHFVSTGKDVTKRILVEKELDNYRKNLEKLVETRTEELEKAKLNAESANRAKTLFLANMSHEIRTPLNAIIGFSQILANDSGISPAQKDKISVIISSGEHLLSLINDILEISKIESGKTTLYISETETMSLLNEVRQMFILSCENKGIELLFETPENLPEKIKTDVKKLRQILINLIGNSVKFTDSGSIKVKAEYDGKETMFFTVTDTGTGIPASDLDRIFERFAQSESGQSRKGGTGLGLSITKEFVKLMRGSISVKSTVGKGSEFSFNIKIIPLTGAASANSVPVINQDAVQVSEKTSSMPDKNLITSTVPSELKKRITEATINGDIELIIQLIENIENPQVRKHLSDLAGAFKFEEILRTLA